MVKKAAGWGWGTETKTTGPIYSKKRAPSHIVLRYFPRHPVVIGAFIFSLEVYLLAFLFMKVNQCKSRNYNATMISYT